MYLNFDQRLKDWITNNQTELTSIGYMVDDVDYIIDQQLKPMEFLLQIYNELDDLSFSDKLTLTFMFEFYDIDILTKPKNIEEYKSLNPGRVICEKLKNKAQNRSTVELEDELTKHYEPREEYLKNEIAYVDSDFFEFSNGMKLKNWNLFVQTIIFDEKDDSNKNIINSNIIIRSKNKNTF